MTVNPRLLRLGIEARRRLAAIMEESIVKSTKWNWAIVYEGDTDEIVYDTWTEDPDDPDDGSKRHVVYGPLTRQDLLDCYNNADALAKLLKDIDKYTHDIITGRDSR